MLGTSFGNVELLDGAKDLYSQSEVKRIQVFYWLSFEDLFDEEIMKSKWVNEKDLDYVLNNREREAVIKSKEAWEMKRGLFESSRWKQIKDFYGIAERDIRDVEKMKQMWVVQKDIDFITGKKETVEEVKEEVDETKTTLDFLKEEATKLWIEFNPRIGEKKLYEKIEAFKLTQNEQ